MKVKVKSNKGFTLAEVVLTLAIIGAVASLTIPNLIQNVSNAKVVAGVRKYQSVLNQAVIRYTVDNGCEGNLTACGLFNVDSITAWNALKPYFAVAKDCGIATGQGCFAKDIIYLSLDWFSWLGLDDSADYAKAVLIDGMSLALEDFAGNCTYDQSRSDTGPLLNTCGRLYVDINGQKRPNQLGRDTFGFHITKQGFYPIGHFDDTSHSTVAGEPECHPEGGISAGGHGFGCAAKVLQEGAVNY